MIEDLHLGMSSYMETPVYHGSAKNKIQFICRTLGQSLSLLLLQPKNVSDFEDYLRIFTCLSISQLHSRRQPERHKACK